MAIEYAADSFAGVKALTGLHRHVRDQWLGATQSIPLNNAEAMKFNGVAESQAEYNAIDDYEHEHEGKPEQRH